VEAFRVLAAMHKKLHAAKKGTLAFKERLCDTPR
jgi:hypothetical protein